MKSEPIVIVGAGIMGLSVAYQLAKRGITNVVVLDRGYLCNGASGRNGGGVRAQWSSKNNIELMQESLQMCRDFAKELRFNVWFRQGGYLFLARDKKTAKTLEKSAELQNACGLDTRLLTAREAARVVPELRQDGIELASFNPKDAVVFPWPFVWGFARGAEKLGVVVRPFTEVTAIETTGGRVSSVRARTVDSAGKPTSSTETIRAHTVINACGAWSPALAKLVDVALPNRPHRHEICSTEPLKPWLGPLVADLGSSLYFSQSTRGEIVGGIGLPKVPKGVNQESSYAFLGAYARALTEVVPVLGTVKVLRQWAGCYDLTPDANPIVGFVDDVPGFYQLSGFMGHGFMMAPVVGKLVAEHFATEEEPEALAEWNLRRFGDVDPWAEKSGKGSAESMIIG